MYYVHSDILLAKSERFVNSLEGDFKEVKDHIVEIEYEDLGLP
jgi:hypothetical protein